MYLLEIKEFQEEVQQVIARYNVLLPVVVGYPAALYASAEFLYSRRFPDQEDCRIEDDRRLTDAVREAGVSSYMWSLMGGRLPRDRKNMYAWLATAHGFESKLAEHLTTILEN